MTSPLRIVTIGGGSGQSTLLTHLKQYPLDISAIVSMTDDGGSTGKLRNDLGALPAGDVRRCLIALAQQHPDLQQLLNYRFTAGSMQGHALGNILLAGLEQQQGNFMAAVESLGHWLNIAGRVLPVTLELTTLEAVLANGLIITGETKIDIPQHDATQAITEVRLQYPAAANPVALEAIAQADVIVLTIGDLFTSIIPNLLVTDIAGAIAQSSAKLVYTCNRATKWGETNNFTALDYVTTLEQYLAGRTIDVIVVNDTLTTDGDTWRAVGYDPIALEQHGLTVVTGDLTADDGRSISGEKLAAKVYQLCQQL